MMKKKIYTIHFLLLSFVVFSTSCKNEHEKYHSVFDKIDHVEKDYIEYSRIDAIDSINFETVHSDNREFFIKRRTLEITSYNCSECHSESMEQLKKGTEAGQKKAHWEISLNHSNDDFVSCSTCHTENDMDKLHTLNGSEVNFDKSYILCGQCHSPQLKDWRGGAHGKQVDGWYKPRISKTCTECHNPHDPSFKHRWPARLVELETEKE